MIHVTAASPPSGDSLAPRGKLAWVTVEAPSTRGDGITPERVGRYEILLPIASGGMATVYLARSLGPNGFATEVALKLTHAHLRTSAEFANDLVEEAKLAVRIRHPNVVSVIDAGDDPNGLYLVMEYVAGSTLAHLTRSDPPLPGPMAVRLLLDALAGLHAAHELRDEDGALVGVVHRDFTPQNILVGIDGVARLADFGIAKAARRVSHTRQGMVKGKIAYMAPEQAQGLPLDRRCDVWAAGVVAWELLAGRRLHVGDDDLATILKVATEKPPLLRTVAPEVPEAVEAAVATALAMSPHARHATALAFSKALAAACRDTLGIAEMDEVAAWMAKHVGPKLATLRSQVARVPSPGELPTREEVVDPPTAECTGPAREVTVAPRVAPIAPTVRLPAPRREPPSTGGVSVVARGWRARRSSGPGPRVLVAAGLLAVLLVGSLAASRLAGRSDPDARDRGRAVATTATASSGLASSASSPGPSPTKLRLHANAVIASLRVNDRDVPVARPGAAIEVDVAGLDQTSSLAIDAVAADGRRTAVAIPAGATDVGLEFPASSGTRAPVRPAAAHLRSHAAPLAPSPYN